jgi:hypothetical protein
LVHKKANTSRGVGFFFAIDFVLEWVL